jgi:hypothetical protein
MAKDMYGSELHALLAEILGQDARVQRTSGYIVHGTSLKAQQATPILRYADELSPAREIRVGPYFAVGVRSGSAHLDLTGAQHLQNTKRHPKMLKLEPYLFER